MISEISNDIHQVTQSGFLLTRQAQDMGDSLQVTLWVKTAEQTVKLLINDQLALFFIEIENIDLAKEVLASANINVVKSQCLALKTFDQTQVYAFYFKTLRAFYQARDVLKSNDIKCYEDDIRPDDRFLMERFITADIDFIGKTQHKKNHQKITEVKCKATSKNSINKSIVLLSMLSIDIECSMEGELYSIGLYANNEGNTIKRVLMIGKPQVDTERYIIWLDNEKQLLQQLLLEISEIDADIFIGWNVINFDFRLLQKRFDLYKLKFSIGRDGSCPYWRQNNNNTEQYFIEIAGRVVLDGIDLLKTATYNFPSFSLDNVANTLLGIGKKVENVENRIQEITENFFHNKRALAQYNLEDCRLVWLIFEKTQLLEFAILRAQLTGLSIDRVGGSVAAFTNLYLPKLHRSGYVAPNMGDGESDLVSPGGYVMNSIPGLYENVLVLDFKSLYPSIIRTFKIDPMGLIEGLNEQRLFDEKPDDKSYNQSIQGFDGAYFSRKKHFLPDIIATLWSARDDAKEQKNAALSQAIKIIMNSFYGVLGSTGCRFFDPRLSGSITKRSHEILKTTKSWIEAKGYQVIYGDTDSIFVHVGSDKSLKESKDLGIKLQNIINEKWQTYITQELKLTCFLEIEFETHFVKFLMPTIRGFNSINKLNNTQSVIGTKKRYAGLVFEGKQQKIIFKGMETVRSDWTDVSKVFQQELYRRVFNNEPVKEYIKDIVEKTYKGEFDQQLCYRKRLRRKLDEYVKNVPPHVKAARHADNINLAQGKPLKYQKRGWIEYFMTLNGAQTKEHLSSLLDYDFYVDRQLKAIADDILPFIETNFDEIMSKQLGLF